MKMNSYNGQVLMNGLKNYMNRNVSHNRYINSVVANAGFGGMGMGMKTAAGIAGMGLGIAGAGYAYNKSRGDRTLGGNVAIGMGAGIAGMGLHGLGAGRLVTGAGMKSLGRKVVGMSRNFDDASRMAGPSMHAYTGPSLSNKWGSNSMFAAKVGGKMNRMGSKMTLMGNSFRGHMGTLQSSKFGSKAAPYMSKAQGLFNKGRDSINDRFRM